MDNKVVLDLDNLPDDDSSTNQSLTELGKLVSEGSLKQLKDAVSFPVPKYDFTSGLAETIKKLNGATVLNSGISESMKKLKKSANLFSNLQMPTFPEPSLHTIEMPAIDMSGHFRKEAEEAEIRRLTLAKLKEEKPIEKITAKDEEPKKDNWYSTRSGIGKIKGKIFKLRSGKSQQNLFNQLIDKGKLPREEIVEILHLQEESSNAIRSVNTLEINKFVKRIRNTTGLNTEELVQNGGNVILDVKIINTQSG